MVWNCNGMNQQQFGYDLSMNTLYLSRSMADASLCVDLYGGSWNNGNPIDIWSCNRCWNQQWIFSDVGTNVLGALQGTTTADAGAEVGSEMPLTCPPIPSPGPAPPPPASGSCMSSANGAWPQFASANELAADPWGKYFTLIYGSIPNFNYPLCIGDFWMFYVDKLTSAGVTKIPKSVGQCAKGAVGTRYDENNKISPPSVTWSWHPIPYKAFGSQDWVEVIHRKDPWGDEKVGAWFFYAKGSGVWYQIGQTISFNDHGDAYKHFHANGNEPMCGAAAKAGYKTVQFLAHSDGGIYGSCRSNPGTPYFNIEIVATAGYGEHTCCARKGTFTQLYAGWNGAKGQCNCNDNKPNLNCVLAVEGVELLNTSSLIARGATMIV